MVLYFCGPDCVQGHEKNVAPPLFLDLVVNLRKVFIFQGLVEIV